MQRIQKIHQKEEHQEKDDYTTIITICHHGSLVCEERPYDQIVQYCFIVGSELTGKTFIDEFSSTNGIS